MQREAVNAKKKGLLWNQAGWLGAEAGRERPVGDSRPLAAVWRGADWRLLGRWSRQALHGPTRVGPFSMALSLCL